MEIQRIHNRIRRCLTYLKSEAEGAVAMGQTDILRLCEVVMCPILKIVLGLENLKVLESERKNYPGIDLGDSKAGVGIQITKKADARKISNTIKKCIKNRVYEKYPKLCIYVLTKKQRRYVRNFEPDLDGKIVFNPKRDILDFTDILRKISHLPAEELREVDKILRDNVGIPPNVPSAGSTIPIEEQIGRADPGLDALIKEKTLPNVLRSAIAEPSLDELSRLLKSRRAHEARAFADRMLQAIDTALDEANHPVHDYKEALRSHRQRLLLAAATASCWSGGVREGRRYWIRALELGRLDSEQHELAAVTAFNIGLVKELRDLIGKMDKESDAYRKSLPMLAFREQNWAQVDKLLVNAESADELLLRVQARLDLVDFEDVAAVRETSDLLDQTDEDDVLPLVNLTRVRLTLELLQKVVRGYTPLEFERRPLINNLVRRLNLALDTTEKDSSLHAQVLVSLGLAAELLRDDQLKDRYEEEVSRLDEAVRHALLPLTDPGLTSQRVDTLLEEGQIDIIRAAFWKAELYKASGEPENVEATLREALRSTSDKRQKANVLNLLTQHLRQANRGEEALRLIEAIPLRPADKWLARSANLPEGTTPLDLVDDVSEFPLDVNVLERLAMFALFKVRVSLSADPSDAQATQKRDDDAIHWASRLTEVLPTASSRLLIAEALQRTRRFRDLLDASKEIDSAYAEEAAVYKGTALTGLGQLADAANVLSAAYRDFPESEHLAIRAAIALLADDRPEQAVSLLASRVTERCRNPDVLVTYARALQAQSPGCPEEASRAFELLKRAYQLLPDAGIEWEALEAARAAGRWADARRLFRDLTAETRVYSVKSVDDLQDAFGAAGRLGVIQIEGGFEHIAEMVRRDQERSGFLDMLLGAHALAYTDYFRHSRRSWERWAGWTQQFEQRGTRGVFSVLAHWPALREWNTRSPNDEELKLLLDQTAILTLGVLGPDTANQILAVPGIYHILDGALEELRLDLKRIGNELNSSGLRRYTKAARFFCDSQGSIIERSQEAESLALGNSDIGPRRIDLGAARLLDAHYVTDSDNSQDLPDEIYPVVISSAVLLASLNGAGVIARDSANVAAKKCPTAFEAWDIAAAIPIPDILVFDEYSALSWVDVGLLGKLGGRVRIGPWAWTRISGEARHQESLEVAHKQLRGTLKVFKKAIRQKRVVEIPPETSDQERVSNDQSPDKSSATIEQFWSGALTSIRTAQANELQLWADDRFYPLLLKWGGPVNMAPQIGGIRNQFADWAKDSPPISTPELLARLSESGRISPLVAQEAVQELFSKGYRAVHPILLARAFRQYPVPKEGPLAPPFQKIVDTITEIPQYFTEQFNELYGNRDRHIRVLSQNVARKIIAVVWKADGLTDDQRRKMADALLAELEHVWKEVSPNESGISLDRTPIMFWQGLVFEFLPIPDSGESPSEIPFDALRWLGGAVASRTDTRVEIVRLLEDNVLDLMHRTLRVSGDSQQGDHFPQGVGKFLLPALIPLIDTDLINELSPLMRRTFGMLVGLPRDGRMDMQYHFAAEREGTPMMVSEEEDERAAAGVLMRAAAGEPGFARRIWATDVVFAYRRSAPQEWVDAGFPAEERITIDVRCSLFILLWADPPGLREIIVHLLISNLSLLDPALAHTVLAAEADLLSDDADVSLRARNWMAITVLQSGYFDLQRNLTHAIRRIRQYATNELARFIGWIGDEAANALSGRSMSTHLGRDGKLLAPLKHFLGRALLSETVDDGVQKHVQEIVSASDQPGENEPPNPSLADFLAEKAILTENADDPFVAAWALWVVLLIISTKDQNPDLDVNGRMVSASDWAAGYIATAINASTESTPELKQLMADRRRLASAALLLSAFATSGANHSQEYDQKVDSVTLWLDWTWLLATKLQIALVGLQGGLYDAANAASAAINELGLSAPNVRSHDLFDPLAFGDNGDDIGIVLTLTAMLKGVRQLPEVNERPTWWTDAIQRRVEELANSGSEDAVTEPLGNRFGLIAQLRERPLAQALIATLHS